MACLATGFPAAAVDHDQLLLAFRNVRSDDVPGNAEAACAWLYAHRSEITPELLDELYRTDRQGRDAIFFALIRTKDFQPDARFCQMLVSRLNEEDRYVKNSDLGIGGLHWVAWIYIDRHYDLFKPLLLDNLQTTTDMFAIWGTVTLFQKHGDLAEMLPKFDQHVWDTAAVSLRADDIEGNAAQAVRFYFLVGTPALPHLQPITTSGESQSSNLASAIVDAMGGSRRAYGYLNSQVVISRDLVGPSPGQEPDWLDEETRKWADTPGQTYR